MQIYTPYILKVYQCIVISIVDLNRVYISIIHPTNMNLKNNSLT